MVNNRTQTALTIILSWGIYILSFLFPRTKRVWVFIGWHHNGEREVFADNSKYFFLHAAQYAPHIRTVWIAKDELLASILRTHGYRAHSVHSLQGIFYSLRAGYTFVDAFMTREHWRLSGKSRIVQLWHGKGMKKTGHDSPYSLKSRSWFKEPNLFVRFSKLIASSPYTARLMASTFKVQSNDILITGLPRNDVLFSNITGADIDEHPGLATLLQKIQQYGRTILYAPTFRPDGSNPIDQLDLPVLNEILVQKNDHFIVSLHPKFARKDTISIAPYSHIHFIEAGYDIYPLLKKIDVLVTDYSSLYVDFLLLDRPIIFFTYDLDTYKIDMGLHENFERLTPGPHIRNFNELVRALTENDTHANARRVVKDELFTYDDSSASKRILDAFDMHT